MVRTARSPGGQGARGGEERLSGKRGKEGIPMGGCEAVHEVLGRNQVDGLDLRGGASSDPAIEHFKRQASDL